MKRFTASITAKLKCRKGFGLIEVVVAIIVIGMVLSTVYQTLLHMNHIYKDNLNVFRMNKLQKVINSYYANHGKLPCPAKPSKTVEGQTQLSCVQSDAVGYLPFKTLGLPIEEAYNAYGHLYTYSVNPHLTTTHISHCDFENTNGPKIVDDSGYSVTDGQEPIAYVLIDHGALGSGSITDMHKGFRRPVRYAKEAMNADDSQNFRKAKSNKDFQHHLMFETRHSLFAESGKKCDVPTH